MAKVRQIFVWNGKEDFGPFRREELVEQLKIGAILPSDYYYEEGMIDWERVARLPCCQRFLATDAQKQMLDSMGITYSEFLTKTDVSAILENQPATEKQLNYLQSFGVSPSTSLTKVEASNLIERCLDDPAARERQSEFRAAEFERMQHEREAFPSYYLKQDVISSERNLTAVKTECDDKKAELLRYRRELSDIQHRLAKAHEETERTAIEQQIASILELIELTEGELADQPEELKECADELRSQRLFRTKFWKATFNRLGAVSIDSDELIDYVDVIDQFYNNYGRYLKTPTSKQIGDILEALDKASPDWDKREPHSFFATYKASFPDSVKRPGVKSAASKQGCVVLIFGALLFVVLFKTLLNMI